MSHELTRPPLSAIKGMRLQPIVGLKENRTVACEALSLLSPQVNIEHFFQHLSVAQTFSLFLWQARALIPMGGTFTVNLPLTVFCDPLRVEAMAALGAGQRIILEIQDAEKLPQLGSAARRQLISQLHRIQEAGYRIWLDDLPPAVVKSWYFPEMHFDGVKLSASAWRGYRAREPALRELVPALRRPGKRVVIEGIESEDALACCRRAGVDCVQGFLFPETVLTL